MAKKVYEVIALLEANGWRYQRTRGDHHVFTKEGNRRPVIIPGARNDTLASGTLASVLRAAGLKTKND